MVDGMDVVTEAKEATEATDSAFGDDELAACRVSATHHLCGLRLTVPGTLAQHRRCMHRRIHFLTLVLHFHQCGSGCAFSL